MTFMPEIQGLSIVMLGNLNPVIFQPAWFAAQELIGRTEAEGAKIEIIHPDVAIFSLDWLRLQVTRDRFSASTEQEAYFETIRDLVFGTFSILRHSPLSIMGINLFMHFRMRSEEEWHAVGHQLAPKDHWKEILIKPGMRRLEMDGHRPDDYQGYIRVRVEPSRRIQPGVFSSVNDHYEIKNYDAGTGCNEILDILGNRWKESLERSKKIILSLLKNTTGDQSNEK